MVLSQDTLIKRNNQPIDLFLQTELPTLLFYTSKNSSNINQNLKKYHWQACTVIINIYFITTFIRKKIRFEQKNPNKPKSTSIYNPNTIGYIWGDFSCQPFPQFLMDFLGLFWCGSLSCTNGPHRLICYYYIGPICCLNIVCNYIQKKGKSAFCAELPTF